MGPKPMSTNWSTQKSLHPAVNLTNFLAGTAQGASTLTLKTDCDDFQRAVLTNRVEYNKIRSISCRMPFIMTFIFLLHLLRGLPVVQYIPATVIGN